MIHSPRNIDQAKSMLVAGYANVVLGFNEPDHAHQSNVDPYYAAQLWKDNIQPLASLGYKLISPAPTNAPSGTQWLRTFMNACTGCTVNAMAAHWYGNNLDHFIGHITEYHNIWNREVWVTEFACHNFGGGSQCSLDQTWALMKGATEFMDNAGWVGRYFWFGALTNMVGVNEDNRLLTSWGTITDLGRTYIGA